MPVIGVSAGLPGTGLGVDVKLAHQTQREKEADLAMQIHEQGSRDRDAACSEDATPGSLDRLMSSPSPLDRFSDHDHAASRD